MLFSVFLSYLPYTIVTAFTPGPNNIIALHAVREAGEPVKTSYGVSLPVFYAS